MPSQEDRDKLAATGVIDKFIMETYADHLDKKKKNLDGLCTALKSNNDDAAIGKHLDIDATGLTIDPFVS